VHEGLLMPFARRSPVLLVRRQCLVCEAEATLEEPADSFEIGTPCGECGAPTERVEVLRRRVVTTNQNAHAAALGRLGGLKGGAKSRLQLPGRDGIAPRTKPEFRPRRLQRWNGRSSQNAFWRLNVSRHGSARSAGPGTKVRKGERSNIHLS
jgi:hypothetical protein